MDADPTTRMKVHSRYTCKTVAKKSSVSSRPEKLVRVKAERVFNKPLTKRQRDMLSRLAKKKDSQIDFSDIPPLTDEPRHRRT